MSRNPTISIVIPHKNSLEKLSRLLASIPEGEFFQTIVIDDNSEPEQNPGLLKSTYKHVEFHINQSGEYNAGSARNIGVRCASGEWLLFADADDYFNTDLLKSVPEIVKELSAFDICYFKVKSIEEVTGLPSIRHTRYNSLADRFLQGDDRELIRYKWAPPWGKLIKKALVDSFNIKFDSVVASNDLIFSLKIGIFAKNIQVIDEVIYFVTKSTDSITARLTPERALARLETLIDYNSIVMDNGITCRMDFGINYFLKSEPWFLSMSKFQLYLRFFSMYRRRLLAMIMRGFSGPKI